MDTLMQDLRYAVRTLRRTPTFTGIAVMTLALGIGATTAIFSAVQATLLRPLPYAAADRLAFARLTSRDPGAATLDTLAVWSYPKFEVLRTAAISGFAGFAGFAREDLSLTGTGEPERLVAELVSSGYFELLGLAPAIGRGFSAAEDAVPAGEAVAVIGDQLWQRRFGGDPRIIGRTIELNRRPFTVVGVARPGFDGLSGNVDVWVPLAQSTTLLWSGALEEPFSHWFQVVARTAPGVTTERAAAIMLAAGRQVGEAVPASWGGAMWSAALVPLESERIDAKLRIALLVLLAAVGLVLLIACVNVANLLLVRGAARGREFAVRRALGATSHRLTRQLVTESALLAAGGGMAGIVLAHWGGALLRRLGPSAGAAGGGGLEGLYGLGDIRIDATVLGFAVAVSLLTALLFGLMPALGASRRDLVAALRAGAGATRITGSIRRLNWQAGLVIAEVALAMVLLAGASLMLGSFAALRSIDFGFRAERVLTFQLDLGSDHYARERRLQFYDALLPRLGGLPGVLATGVATCAPLSGTCNRTILRSTRDRPDIPPEEAQLMGMIGMHYASAGSFEALGVPLVQGRLFDGRDRDGAPKVVVINQAAARMVYPGEDPIGKPLGLGVSFTRRGEPAEIIGVVGDVRYQAPDAPAIPEAYASVLQAPGTRTMVFMRTVGHPRALADDAARTVRELDPDLPIFQLATMQERVSDTLADARFISVLLSLFAGLALALAAIGLYGVLACSVAGRTREIGVRVALGGAHSDVVRVVLRDAGGLVLTGLILGTGGALVATRGLGALLYGVHPGDTRALAVAAAVLLGAAFLASLVPARRAARVDPIQALRTE